MLNVTVTLELSYVFLLSSLIVRFMYYLYGGGGGCEGEGVYNFQSCKLHIVFSFTIRRRFRIVDIIRITLYKLTV
jgi:hypothetical protein